MPGFKVVRDFYAENKIRKGIFNPKYDIDRRGKQSTDYIDGENHIRVKTYDDDGNLYYEMVCATEKDAERAHEWSQFDSGSVSSKIKIGKGEWINFIG